MAKTTYVVEDAFQNILEYCRTLKKAKWVANTYGGTRIYSMVGAYFGEGFHKREWVLIQGAWKRNTIG